MKATARAGSNIAFIKYWGVADKTLNLPLNDSISMTLDTMFTVTTVEFDEGLAQDEVIIGGNSEGGLRAERFLILPHEEVLDFWQRKTADIDRWLKGMRRLRAKVMGADA